MFLLLLLRLLDPPWMKLSNLLRVDTLKTRKTTQWMKCRNKHQLLVQLCFWKNINASTIYSFIFSCYSTSLKWGRKKKEIRWTVWNDLNKHRGRVHIWAERGRVNIWRERDRGRVNICSVSQCERLSVDLCLGSVRSTHSGCSTESLMENGGKWTENMKTHSRPRREKCRVTRASEERTGVCSNFLYCYLLKMLQSSIKMFF